MAKKPTHVQRRRKTSAANRRRKPHPSEPTLGQTAMDAGEETSRLVRKWAPKLGRKIMEVDGRIRSVAPGIRMAVQAEAKGVQDRRQALSAYRERENNDQDYVSRKNAEMDAEAQRIRQAQMSPEERDLRLRALRADYVEEIADHLGVPTKNVRTGRGGELLASRGRPGRFMDDPLTTAQGQRALKKMYQEKGLKSGDPEMMYELTKLRKKLSGEAEITPDMDAVDRFRRELRAQREAEARERQEYRDKMQRHSDVWEGQRTIRGGLEGQEGAIAAQEAALARRRERLQAAEASKPLDLRRGKEVE